MKKIFTIIALFFFCMPGIASSQTANHKKQAKVKATATDVSEKNANGNTSNYSIHINGPQNLVTITTDSLKVQTTVSLPNKAETNNTVDINGQGNTVAISQENKNDKVVVSQNGNNNSVNISQSNHRP